MWKCNNRYENVQQKVVRHFHRISSKIVQKLYEDESIKINHMHFCISLDSSNENTSTCHLTKQFCSVDFLLKFASEKEKKLFTFLFWFFNINLRNKHFPLDAHWIHSDPAAILLTLILAFFVCVCCFMNSNNW